MSKANISLKRSLRLTPLFFSVSETITVDASALFLFSTVIGRGQALHAFKIWLDCLLMITTSTVAVYLCGLIGEYENMKTSSV